MPIDAAVEELSDQELKVQNWRIEQLLGMGLEMETAIEVAKTDMDMGEVRRLIREKGCEPELAVKILRD